MTIYDPKGTRGTSYMTPPPVLVTVGVNSYSHFFCIIQESCIIATSAGAKACQGWENIHQA